MERKHHPMGFSKWPMISVCPSFDSVEQTNKAAEEGTAKHVDFEESINEINTGVPALHSTESAKWAAEYVASVANGAKVNSETKVVDVGTGVFGYCDAWCVTADGQLCVFDYKSGARTDLDQMPQVMGYAHAILTMDELGLELDPSKAVACYLLYGASHEVVKSVFTYNDLALMSDVCMASCAHSGSVFNMSPACRYCKHKDTCPALGHALAEFKRNFLSDLSDAKKYYVLSSMKSAIEAEIERLKGVAAENGGVLDDGEYRYETKTSRGKAKANDIVNLWQELCDRNVMIEQSDIMKACTISKTAFRDLCRDEAKANGVKVKELDEMYERNTVYGDDVTRLVRVERTSEA